MRSRKKPTSKSYKIRVGITMGDPSGIGPEIAAKALARLKGRAVFTLIGDKWVFSKVHAGRVQGFELLDLKNVPHKNFSFGKVKARYGRASLEYLDKALELIRTKQIDCLVTCPVSKEAINRAGLKGFRGHTEYLAEACAIKKFAMLLLNKDIKFSLVTRHIPLSQVSQKLSKEEISRNIYLTRHCLKRLFAIASARIVVCGLNPHASDNSVIGDEEERVISPALKDIKKRVKNIFGPYPADTAIAALKEKKYDCAIAMYHDQALIPLKLTGAASGVNMTLGLPFIRTSPLHGTAFDIAGLNRANPDSLIEAIRLAIRCASNLRKG